MSDPRDQERLERAHDSMRRVSEIGFPERGRGLAEHQLLIGTALDELIDRSKHDEHVRVLFVGAGAHGREVAELVEEIDRTGGYEPFIISDSPTFAEEDAKRAVHEGMKEARVERTVTIEDFAHDLESVPDGFCTFVFIVNVFQHLLPSDISDAVREVLRVLAPGGKAVITPLATPEEPDADLPPEEREPVRAARELTLRDSGALMAEFLDKALTRATQGRSDIKVFRQDIPFEAILAAQGSRLSGEREPYIPQRVVIQKL